MIELKREGNERELEGKERLAALEAEIKSRDNQLEIFRRSMDIHSRQAEKAIEEFKTEVRSHCPAPKRLCIWAYIYTILNSDIKFLRANNLSQE